MPAIYVTKIEQKRLMLQNDMTYSIMVEVEVDV